MSKIVVLANTRDGHINWDEAEIRQPHKGSKLDLKSNHQRRRDHYNKDDLHVPERSAPVRARQNMRAIGQDLHAKFI